LGGKIEFDGDDWRIENLSVSRAFGDVKAGPYVTHVPDVFKYRLGNKDQFMILACDGLWDVMTNQEVVDFVLHICYDQNMVRIDPGVNIAKKLADIAVQKGSTDNITIIISFF